MQLDHIRTVLFDMDGVLYRGKTVLPGVHDLLAFLQQRDIRYACITNNASMTPEQYEEKLAAMGIAMPARLVLTSALVTNHYLRQHYPRGTTVYVIGMRGLRELLFSDGYFVEQTHGPQLVVQGADFEVTYEKLRLACLAIRGGARYIATNPDRTFPSEEGLIPGAGAIGAALTAATEVEPFVIGKPQPTMFLAALEMLGGTAETALTIGDRLDTDIAGSLAANVPSALVLTGVATRDELATSPYQPTVVFTDLPELLEAWQQTGADQETQRRRDTEAQSN
ncbi:MAG: HAD-IIA family hydrolase [Chloroflexaceae bacterium]|jgi:4-nitrophenyl phosphatase|nr:HAD-IIA family hydrolase [Chloroflexaceae bacterium]